MNILIKVGDNAVDHPQLGHVPVVTFDMKSVEEVDATSEPTPAMWTAACIYDMHVTGELMQRTRAFMLSKKTEVGEIVSEDSASGDGVVGD